MNQTATPVVSSSPQLPWETHTITPLARRRRGRGFLLSCLIHGGLLATALWGFVRVVEEPPPTIRLVFTEPPPPPPAPLGAPTATGTTATPEQPPAVVEKPKPVEQVKPKHKEPERLKIAKKNKKPEPLPEPEPVSPESETGPETAAVMLNPQAGIAAGAAGGEAGGVIGGVKGGVSGGVVGGQGTGPLPVGQVANPPVLISRALPQYPRQARLQSIEGLVLLEAILDREGHIENDVKVLRSIPLLDEAAIEALRRWRFRPARDHRLQTVRVILEVPIRFVLK